MDYDKIMVLSNGQIIEYDSPQNLLSKDVNDESAIFKNMVSDEVQNYDQHNHHKNGNGVIVEETH